MPQTTDEKPPNRWLFCQTRSFAMLQEILSESRKRLPMLEAMTKEERIEYFRKGLFPRKLDFDLDFGSTVIHVNTRFAENSKENVIDRVRRVSDKIN